MGAGGALVVLDEVNLMDFDLKYHGPLRGASRNNPRADHKHDLRRHFHTYLEQLAQLPGGGYGHVNWRTEAEIRSGTMVEIPGQPRPPGPPIKQRNHYVEFGAVRYVPLITRAARMTCHLEIVLHRREAPGGIIAGADIDNRL